METFCNPFYELIIKGYTPSCFECSLFAVNGASNELINQKRIRKNDDKIRQHSKHRRMCDDMFAMKK